MPLFEVYTSWQERRSQRTRLLAAAAAAQQQQQEQHRQQQDVAPHIVSRAALASKPGSKIALQAARGTLRGRVLAVPKQRAAQGQAQAAQHAQRAQHEEQLRPADLFYAKLRVRAFCALALLSRSSPIPPDDQAAHGCRICAWQRWSRLPRQPVRGLPGGLVPAPNMCRRLASTRHHRVIPGQRPS